MSDRIDELEETVRTACEVIDDEGSTPSRPCTVYGDALTELATIVREKVHCGGVIESTSGECVTLMKAQNAAFDAEERALKAEAERDALLAEHKAVAHLNDYLVYVPGWEPQERLKAAHDNAERVIRG